ncbi:membrane protein [Roseivivax halodurans JCM 10272]|uniref:Membrane protein n=1 Tax=Roseivivax halodurans JCM 10272 TaxID=1449350 RepID=X7EB10_9RHOB|nr:DMT family transporter [Roseivivax halodurans]ETX13137.1 membrane protein [Roseivivax halodurans JCM 10272]
MAPNAKAALIALLGFGLFAGHDALVKVLGAEYSSFQIVFINVLFGFPLVTLTLIRDRAPGHLRPIHPWWITLRTCAAIVTAMCAFYAFSEIQLAQVYAVLFAAPLLITVLSIPILGEVVRARRWAAVIVGLLGVIVVLQPGTTELSFGHLAALGAAVGSALASVISRKIGQDERSVVLVLYPMLANFAILGAIQPLVYKPMPLGDLAINAALAAFGFAAAMLMVRAYREGEAVVVAPMQYSQILWATALGILFFDEVPDLPTLAGAGIVIASGVYIVLRESRGSTSEQRPVLQTRSRFDTATWPRISAVMRMTKPPLPGAPVRRKQR